MNRSKVTYGILAALMLNLATPAQAGWFSNWFSSRGAKVTVAASAAIIVAATAGYVGYLVGQWNKKAVKKRKRAITHFVQSQGEQAASPTPSVQNPSSAAATPTVAQESTLERLARQNIAVPMLPAEFAKQIGQVVEDRRAAKAAQQQNQ